METNAQFWLPWYYRRLFKLFISTRTKKDVLNGRMCTWHIYINFHHLHYGYVQIDNDFVGTIDQAKQYAEIKLREIKEGIPV